MKLSIPLNFFAMTAFLPSSCIAGKELLTFDGDEDGYATVVRNYVDKNIAEQLYEDLIEAGFPKTEDHGEIHPGVVETFGDAGSLMDNAPLAHEAINVVNASESKSSMVFRLEHLEGSSYDLSKDQVNQVVPNNILEEGGTIHLYVSSPGAAALGNHTDTTDIFVLHLGGAKDWLFCKEPKEQESDRKLSDKLNTCSTYDEDEIGALSCTTETLFPGDALFLPMRVMHSARAVSKTPSAHLTFAFFNEEEDAKETCSESYSDVPLFLRAHRKLCDKQDYKCASNCDNGCDRSCDKGCDKSCDGMEGDTQCDKRCDIGCNTGCDNRCNSGCHNNC